jgi:hypothetical protein
MSNYYGCLPFKAVWGLCHIEMFAPSLYQYMALDDCSRYKRLGRMGNLSRRLDFPYFVRKVWVIYRCSRGVYATFSA